MTQNTSHAVMSQRAEPPGSLDYFPTPPWATRALCEHLDHWGRTGDESAWDPACGEGHMARPLAEYFARVEASDIHDYGQGYPVGDFLADGLLPSWEPAKPVHWIVTNPPFNKAAAFARRGLELAETGVCLLVRTSFLEGIDRHATLFTPHPPEWICQFAERVPMLKGRLSRTASSATAYCWLVWVQPATPRRHGAGFTWIPPCRKRLERAGDYGGMTARVMSTLAVAALLSAPTMCLAPAPALPDGPPAAGPIPCMPLADMDRVLRARHAETPLWRGIDGAGRLVVVYQGPRETWTAVIAQPGGDACIVSAGRDGGLLRRTPKGHPA